MSKSTRSSERLSNVDNAATKAFSRAAKNRRIDPNNDFKNYTELFSHFNDLMHSHIEGDIEFNFINDELNKYVLWEQHCVNEVVSPLAKNFTEPSTGCFSKMTCSLYLGDRQKGLPTGMSKGTKKCFLSLKKSNIDSIGVFAEQSIEKDAVFTTYIGNVVTKENTNNAQ